MELMLVQSTKPIPLATCVIGAFGHNYSRPIMLFCSMAIVVNFLSSYLYIQRLIHLTTLIWELPFEEDRDRYTRPAKDQTNQNLSMDGEGVSGITSLAEKLLETDCS